MNIVNLRAIVSWIKREIQSTENPRLQKLQKAKILTEAPIQESEELVLQCSILPPTLESEVTKIALLRCNLSAGKAEVADYELLCILESLVLILCEEEMQENLGFGLYKITEAGGSPPMVDNKGRNIRVKDFYLHYTL